MVRRSALSEATTFINLPLPIATVPDLTCGTFRFEQIKLKVVHEDAADLEGDGNREELLQFLNSWQQ